MSHRYSRNPDHIRKRNVPAPDNQALSNQIRELLSPIVYSQQAYYQSLGMRERILTLPLMVAAVLTLLWRQVPSVNELTRMLHRENLLWAQAVKVSRQAVTERFLTFPYQIFERVLRELVPRLKARWNQRNRPLPPSVSWGMKQFDQIWAIDGSALESLFRKLDSLKHLPVGQLAGKICTVIELASQLPVEIWFEENAKTHDCQFLERILTVATEKTLLLIDRGFYDFQWWSKLISQGVDFICAAKSNLVYEVVQNLSLTNNLKDRLIIIGRDSKEEALLTLRLIEIRHGKSTYRYLTSVTSPEVLPPYIVADIYSRRWRIEDGFHLVKRLLGLSYLWTGSINGIKLQIWATWLIYAVLVDLSDEVAQTLQLPLERISKEMVFRGLYHFNTAYSRGLADDPVVYLSAPENRDLGVIKSIRKPPKILDFSPYFSSSISTS